MTSAEIERVAVAIEYADLFEPERFPPDQKLHDKYRMIAQAAIRAMNDWKPTSEAPEAPGTYINVRTVTTYRWLAYKPDGARQMKKAGRWQRVTEHGWENATLPDGDFVPNIEVDTDAG